MEETKLYPDQVTRDRYIADLDAVRQELYDFSALSMQMQEMNDAIKQEERDMEDPDVFQKIWALKWYFVAFVVMWYVSDFLINITMSPEGEPAIWATALGLITLAFPVYIVYLWKHPARAYSRTNSYKKRLEELEVKRNEVNKVAVKKTAAETEVVTQLYYVPSKYMFDTTIYKLEEYMKHNGARTLAEAINMFEASHR